MEDESQPDFYNNCIRFENLSAKRDPDPLPTRRNLKHVNQSPPPNTTTTTTSSVTGSDGSSSSNGSSSSGSSGGNTTMHSKKEPAPQPKPEDDVNEEVYFDAEQAKEALYDHMRRASRYEWRRVSKYDGVFLLKAMALVVVFLLFVFQVETSTGVVSMTIRECLSIPMYIWIRFITISPYSGVYQTIVTYGAIENRMLSKRLVLRVNISEHAGLILLEEKRLALQLEKHMSSLGNNHDAFKMICGHYFMTSVAPNIRNVNYIWGVFYWPSPPTPSTNEREVMTDICMIHIDKYTGVTDVVPYFMLNAITFKDGVMERLHAPSAFKTQTPEGSVSGWFDFWETCRVGNINDNGADGKAEERHSKIRISLDFHGDAVGDWVKTHPLEDANTIVIGTADILANAFHYHPKRLVKKDAYILMRTRDGSDPRKTPEIIFFMVYDVSGVLLAENDLPLLETSVSIQLPKELVFSLLTVVEEQKKGAPWCI